MPRIPRIIARDFLGLTSVCGPAVALRWLWAVLTHLSACKRAGNLQPADAAVGPGPFHLKQGRSRALLGGQRILTGVRELWVRNVYLRPPLAIGPEATVVDLGASCGTFTALALGHGPAVRALSVEANPADCLNIHAMLRLNAWENRATVINAFVGGKTPFQSAMAPAPSVTPADILRLIPSGRIHFLKCDIEGSEFELFSADNPLLAVTDQIAIEVHPDAGDAPALLDRLRTAGFDLFRDEFPPTILVRGIRHGATPFANPPAGRS